LIGNVELRHLRAFAAVAEELHFTRAAERLHLAQQALSSQIRQLETVLGTQLFYRTTRKVELTPAGEVLLMHARRILDALETAWTETRQTGSGESGHLRVGYTPTVAAESLPRLAAGLRERFPAIKLTTCELWPHEAVNGVLTGLFDAALSRAAVLPDGLEAVTIRHEPLGVILGAAHRAARRPVVPVEELADDVLALWPRDLSPGFYELAAEAFPANRDAGRIYEFENFAREGFLDDVVARMEIAASRAFSVAFETQYEELPKDFVWRPIDPAPLIGLEIVHRAGRVPAPVRSLVETAREVAEREGWLASAGPVAA
jgi:DNA-binding transcriptional LysR family regulator